MKKRKYILKVNRSRKTYLLVYLMVLAILFSIGYLYYLGKSPSNLSLIVSAIFIYFSLKITELHRFRDWWAITSNSLIQSTGIFNKNIREIGFSSISDLDLDQPFFKRILNYGNVNVRLFLNETSIKIINVNRPSEFIDELQRVMSMNRELRDGIRKI